MITFSGIELTQGLTTYFIETLTLYLLLSSMLQKRRRVRPLRFGGCIIVALVFAAQVSAWLAGIDNGLTRFAVTIAIDLIASALFYNGGLLKKILFPLLFYVFTAVSEMTTTAVYLLAVGGFGPVESWADVPVILVPISHAILFGIVLLFRKLCGKIKDGLNQTILLIIISIIVCTYIAVVSPLGDEENIYYSLPIIPFMVSIIAILGAALLIIAVGFYRQKVKHADTISLMQERYNAELITQHKRLSAIYHDIGNHLAYLEMRLASQEDKSYVRELRAGYSGLLKKTGHSAVDMIIAVKRPVMEEKAIKLEVRGTLPENIGWLEPIDVITILGNALDNAINAMTSVTPEFREPVKLEVVSDGNRLALRVINQTGDIKRKKNIPGHGYGLKNIKNAVDRYDGNMSVEKKDGYFVLSVLLYGDNK